MILALVPQPPPNRVMLHMLCHPVCDATHATDLFIGVKSANHTKNKSTHNTIVYVKLQENRERGVSVGKMCGAHGGRRSAQRNHNITALQAYLLPSWVAREASLLPLGKAASRLDVERLHKRNERRENNRATK